jgi:hypothetical protein
MANLNYSRALKFNEKRITSVFSAELNESATPDAKNGTIGVASQNYLLGVLPPNAIVTNAYVFVKTAANAATSSAATLGTAEAGSQLASAINLKTLGKQGTFTGALDTGTGAQIFLGITNTGAANPVGKYVVVVEYLEYTKGVGELTNIV